MDFTIWTKGVDGELDGYNEHKITVSDKYGESERVMIAMAVARYIDFGNLHFPAIEIGDEEILYDTIKEMVKNNDVLISEELKEVLFSVNDTLKIISISLS